VLKKKKKLILVFCKDLKTYTGRVSTLLKKYIKDIKFAWGVGFKTTNADSKR